MIRRSLLGALLSAILTLTSCARAERYPPAPAPKMSKPEQRIEEIPYALSWIERHETPDVPIVFVAQTSAEWPGLKTYWNEPPHPAAMRLSHVGLTSLHALSAVAATEHQASIKIKVPRGLPDPTPNVPPTNPLTLAKWQLGKKLFFENMLRAGEDSYSCAKCHDPTTGFTERGKDKNGPSRNTLSLLNVVYNRRQFWDGRVETLEETLVRSLDDERTVASNLRRAKALEQHIWGGTVGTLAKRPAFVQEFKSVFGVRQPTQDTIARALATYLRTILSGDSLYDRIEEIRHAKKAPVLTLDQVKEALKEKDSNIGLRDPEVNEVKAEELPARVFQGYELFKKHCVQCHRGPLFTDQDYHNVGYLGAEARPKDAETGRVAAVPIGLKGMRLFGAYRTPSLRNLPRTDPYFHDSSELTASHFTLMRVVEFYNEGVLPGPHLAEAMKEDGKARRLGLTKAEQESLVLFLRTLDGTRAHDEPQP